MSAVTTRPVLARPMSWLDVPALVDLETELFGPDAWDAPTWWAELAARPRRDYLTLTADDVVVGYAGLLDLGYVAFYAVGAYTVAVLTSQHANWPYLLTIPVAVAAAMLSGVILGAPTLRVRGDYLAIVTIAAAEIVRYIVRTQDLTDVTGGSQGIRGNQFKGDIQGVNDAFLDLPTGTWYTAVSWALVVVAVIVVWGIMRSPWGRVVKGIREDEDAVRSLGKNVYAYKMQSLMIGGLIGGLAGIMSALQHSAINPSFFATDTTFFAYTVLLVGGAARVLGPVAGTIIFWFLLSFLDLTFGAATSGANPTLPEAIMNSNQASLMRFIFMGLALMLLMIFRPQGILGDKRELRFNV